MLTLARTEAFLKTFPRLTIGLVGDLWLERQLLASTEDTGAIERVRNAPGALGSILRCLAGLGVGLLVPVSVLGDDGHGFDLLREVRRLPVDPAHLLCWSDRLTPTTTTLLQPLADGSWRPQQQFEVRSRAPLAANATATVCEHLRMVFHSSDGLIVLDQVLETDCGVVNQAVRATLAELAAERPDKHIVVASRAHLVDFEGVTCVGDQSQVGPATTLARQQQRAVYLVQGDRGMGVALPSGETLPAAGAVDWSWDDLAECLTGSIAAALVAGAKESEAAMFGNLVAELAWEQPTTVRPAQVLARWQENCQTAGG